MLWSKRAGTAASENRRAAGCGARWWLVLPASVGVAILTYLLQQLVIYFYIFGPGFLESSVFGPLFPAWGPLEVGQAEAFGNIVGLYLMPALHLFLTAGAALWVGRRVGAAAPLHGVLIGVVAAVANQTIGLTYEPPIAYELAIYPLLGVVGGLVGGFWGWNIRSGEEALHRVSRAVGAARTADEIAAGIGKNLAGSEANGVSLWVTPGKIEAEEPEEPEEPEDYEIAGSWTRKEGTWPSGLRPDAARASGLSQKSLFQRSASLSEIDRRAWESWGVRTVLLVPLVSACGESVGILMVASRKRRGFSRADRRAYSTAASQSALALENLRLIKEARQAATLRERQRMAHEIHDTLAQGFTSIVMNVEAAEGALHRNSQAVHNHHEQIGQTARESLAEARRLVWALSPERLEHDSLPEALGKLTEGWSAQSGVPCGIEVIGTPRSLSAETEATLLRCGQEALSNARKHARASRVGLTLSYVGESVILDVCDDGVGFDPSSATSPNGSQTGATGDTTGNSGNSGGFGLRAMRERAERAGGTLSVESAAEEGTSLAIELPLETDSPDPRANPEITTKETASDPG